MSEPTDKPQHPAQGGSFTRDPVTGALVREAFTGPKPAKAPDAPAEQPSEQPAA